MGLSRVWIPRADLPATSVANAQCPARQVPEESEFGHPRGFPLSRRDGHVEPVTSLAKTAALATLK